MNKNFQRNFFQKKFILLAMLITFSSFSYGMESNWESTYESELMNQDEQSFNINFTENVFNAQNIFKNNMTNFLPKLSQSRNLKKFLSQSEENSVEIESYNESNEDFFQNILHGNYREDVKTISFFNNAYNQPVYEEMNSHDRNLQNQVNNDFSGNIGDVGLNTTFNATFYFDQSITTIRNINNMSELMIYIKKDIAAGNHIILSGDVAALTLSYKGEKVVELKYNSAEANGKFSGTLFLEPIITVGKNTALKIGNHLSPVVLSKVNPKIIQVVNSDLVKIFYTDAKQFIVNNKTKIAGLPVMTPVIHLFQQYDNKLESMGITINPSTKSIFVKGDFNHISMGKIGKNNKAYNNALIVAPSFSNNIDIVNVMEDFIITAEIELFNKIAGKIKTELINLYNNTGLVGIIGKVRDFTDKLNLNIGKKKTSFQEGKLTVKDDFNNVLAENIVELNTGLISSISSNVALLNSDAGLPVSQYFLTDQAGIVEDNVKINIGHGTILNLYVSLLLSSFFVFSLVSRLSIYITKMRNHSFKKSFKEIKNDIQMKRLLFQNPYGIEISTASNIIKNYDKRISFWEASIASCDTLSFIFLIYGAVAYFFDVSSKFSSVGSVQTEFLKYGYLVSLTYKLINLFINSPHLKKFLIIIDPFVFLFITALASLSTSNAILAFVDKKSFIHFGTDAYFYTS